MANKLLPRPQHNNIIDETNDNYDATTKEKQGEAIYERWHKKDAGNTKSQKTATPPRYGVARSWCLVTPSGTSTTPSQQARRRRKGTVAREIIKAHMKVVNDPAPTDHTTHPFNATGYLVGGASMKQSTRSSTRKSSNPSTTNPHSRPA